MKIKQMNPLLVVALAALAVAVLVAGTVCFFVANVIVNGNVYPRNAEFLNLREEELTVEEYDAIRAKLPDCQLYWNIPFQGSTYPEDTEELTVAALTDADVAVLAYFGQLKTVRAEECRDYPQLQALHRSGGSEPGQNLCRCDPAAHHDLAEAPVASGPGPGGSAEGPGSL